MMPALSLLLTNYTMGSLPCGLGGYPHTPDEHETSHEQTTLIAGTPHVEDKAMPL